MANITKHFFNKLLNTDDADHLQAAGEYLSLHNLRFGTSESKTGYIENIKGTVKIYQPIRPYNGIFSYQCIGACVSSDEAERYLVWFVYSPPVANPVKPAWCSIVLYDKSTGSIYQALTSDNCATLNFSPNRLIHSAKMVNGALYWTDGQNPPRMLYMGAAIKALNNGNSPLATDFVYSGMLSEDDIALYRKPFPLPPSIAKIAGSAGDLNRIKNDSFKFAVQYIYWNGEKSVLSPFSRTSFVNTKEQTETLFLNGISVKLPISATIPQGVRIVRFCALNDTTKFGNVFRSFDKKNAADLALITAHNNAATPLAANFYNNVLGEALDAAELIQSFHSVPEVVNAMELARNRLKLANYREGKDTPALTSLAVTASAANISSGGVSTQGKHMQVMGTDLVTTQTIDAYVIFLSMAAVPGWYYVTSTYAGQSDSYPTYNAGTAIDPLTTTTLAMSDLTFLALELDDALQALLGSIFTITSYSLSDIGQTVLVSSATPSNGLLTQFKSGGEYQFGIVFYDAARRKCGVVTKEQLRLAIAERNYAFTARTPSVGWALSATPAAGEIPSWATHYAIVRTLNQKTRFFVDSLGTIAYYKKDTSGEWIDGGTAWDSNIGAIGIDTTALVQTGLGYSLTENDVCNLMESGGTVHELPVIGMAGKFILLQAKNLGTISNTTKYAYEVFTPYEVKSNEPYYEIGEIFPIAADPATSAKRYSVLAGEIPGDCFTINRTFDSVAFAAECMNPNDKYWMRWDTHAGFINIVLSKGSYWNKTGLRFSNTYIPGTDTNGLSAFEALNQESLPIELGQVMKLQLTSKAQSEGTVMLAIGTTQTASVYLGEGQISDTSGNAALIRTVGVVGQVNVLQGNLGTLHPESVVLGAGRVFWIDATNACFAAYGQDGLNRITSNKLHRIAKLLCNKIALQPGNYRLAGGFDAYHAEALFSIPQTESEPPAGALAPYANRNSPYDFYDGRAKTWVYKNEADRFMGAFDFLPEYFVSVGEALFAFKNGALYQCNAGEYNTLFDTVVTPSIAFVENGAPDSSIKVFASLALEGNRPPSFTHLRTEHEAAPAYEQSTDLADTDWKELEGVYYAAILRDMLSPNTPGDQYDKLRNGDPMRGNAAKIYLEFAADTANLKLKFINVYFRPSSGHKNI
jgi:hypothetical protein